MEKTKPKVAIFQIGSCEGCVLQFVNLEEAILDLLNAIDLVYCREIMTENSDKFPEIDFDIALIEGSVLTNEEAEEIKKIREKAKIVIALGACAHIGGINCLANNMDLKDKKKMVYEKDSELVEGLKDSITPRPINAVIKVDAFIPGCPVNAEETAKIITDLLLGKTPSLPECPVCMECAMKENGCLIESGIACLGSITRKGCGALCPSNKKGCLGCRGFLENRNETAAFEILKKTGLTAEEIEKALRMFNGRERNQKEDK